MALKLGMTHVHFPYQYPRLPVDASHERFVVDHNRCILCARCVRVCDEIEGAHTWDIMSRGVDCRVITDLAQPWGKSESCTGCGKCVQVCPTGALSEKGKSVAEMSKRRQFLPYLTLMRELGLPPGRQIGEIVRELLEEVVENPTLNHAAKLLERAKMIIARL